MQEQEIGELKCMGAQYKGKKLGESTAGKAKQTRLAMAVYCAIFFAVIAAPMLAMPFFPGATERELPAAAQGGETAGGQAQPQDQDQAQRQGPAQAGGLLAVSAAASARIRGFEDFIDSSFGFRRQLIALDAAFRERAFGESSNEKIVIGSDGWLYLAETLDPSSAANSASERLAARIARTLALHREYLEGQGTGLLFAAAPNKARVYGEYLPYYAPLPNAGDGGLLGAVNRRLDACGVARADLAALFAKLNSATEKADNVYYYHKLDTHWNYLGAAEVYRELMGLMSESGRFGGGLAYDAYEDAAPAAAQDWQGDLEAMLNPVAQRLDTQYRYGIERTFRTRRPLVNEEDMTIVSASGRNGANVLFFRDSFANSLIQFFSNNLGGAEYLRAMPYQLARAGGGAFDMAIIEIVERNLPLLVKSASAVPAPSRGAGEITPLLARAREAERARETSGSMAESVAGEIADGAVGREMAAGAARAATARTAGSAGAAAYAAGDASAASEIAYTAGAMGAADAAWAAGGSPARTTGEIADGAAGVAAWIEEPGDGGVQGAYAHIYGFFSPEYLSSFGETRIYAIFERAGATGGAENGAAGGPDGGIYAFEAYPILEADAIEADAIEADAIEANTGAGAGDAEAGFGVAGSTFGAAAGERGAALDDCGFSFCLDDSAMPAGSYRLSLLLHGEDGSAARSGDFLEYTISGRPQG
jgi:hypothetical protein